MNTNAIIIGVAAVAGVLTKMSSDSDSAKIAANIRATARSQASTNANWADEFSISMKRNDALGKLRRFESQERSRIDKAFNDNSEAKAAVKEFNKLNRQYEEAKKAVDNFKRLDDELKLAKGNNERSVESLLNDRDWTHKEFVKEFQKTHTQAGIIAKGCLYSALPVAALVLIWKGTISELAILKEVV